MYIQDWVKYKNLSDYRRTVLISFPQAKNSSIILLQAFGTGYVAFSLRNLPVLSVQTPLLFDRPFSANKWVTTAV